jgi:hypothetical protein
MAKLTSPAFGTSTKLLQDASVLLLTMYDELRQDIEAATDATDEKPTVARLEKQFAGLYMMLHWARAQMLLPSPSQTIVSGKSGKMVKR